MAIEKTKLIHPVIVDFSEILAASGADVTLAEFMGTDNHGQAIPDSHPLENSLVQVRDMFSGVPKKMEAGWSKEKDAELTEQILAKAARKGRRKTR